MDGNYLCLLNVRYKFNKVELYRFNQPTNKQSLYKNVVVLFIKISLEKKEQN